MDKPKDKVISKHISELEEVNTAHSVGIKQVFLSHSETNTDITQVAYGKLNPGEVVEEHLHLSMEEMYFFTQGKGLFLVEGAEIELEKDVFIKIPAGYSHSLQNTGEQALCFFYFGIASKQ